MNTPFSYSLPQNSVRHNLSLHSRFVKVQNDTSGKSSWWTVNLDAKSGRTSRRRSHSVDNTNAPSPKTRKREKRKMKKVSKGSSTENILSSPCASPTLAQLQPPWSPNPSCPSPTGSDLSPCYSPVLHSPVLHRSSRNATPVSPLISPPGLDQQGASVFSGSNSSLLDSDTHTPDFGDPGACVDMLAQLNLRSSREHMGSSSSLSSLNSPRPVLPASNKSPHPVFNFSNGTIDSSGYSSSTYYSDTDLPEPANLPPPPAYEEHITHQSRPLCYTPTRSGTHPLHITLSADTARPRSGSEPAVNHTARYTIPQDIDMDLINSNFPGCDVDTILQSELQFDNAQLDFSFDQKQHSPHPNHLPNGTPTHHTHRHPPTTGTSPSPSTTNHYHQAPHTPPNHTAYHRAQHPASTSPIDPTLTSAALQADPYMMQGHNMTPASTSYWAH